MTESLTRRWVYGVLGIAIFAAYFSSLHGSFHFDDSHSVEANLAIRSMSQIPSFWLDASTSSFIPENRVYRPLVYTFYSICWALGGGATWPFHVMKWLMHWMVCICLFEMWAYLWARLQNVTNSTGALDSAPWKLSGEVRFTLPVALKLILTPVHAAFLLALVFAVHPTGTECVDYISATTSLQAAMFYLMAYVAYLNSREAKVSKYLFASLLFYFFSVASKEEGITLVAMVFFTELFLTSVGSEAQLKTNWIIKLKHAVRVTVPYAVLAIVLAGWIYYMHPTEGNESRGFVSNSHYFMTQWRAYLWYMRLWFWPFDLNADSASYEFSTSFWDVRVLQALAGNLFLLITAWIYRKRFPAFLFGLVWFYVTISPASSVVVLAEAINEHRMYLAYAGFVGGTATLLFWLAQAVEMKSPEKRSGRLGWLFLVVVALCLVGVQTRNKVWLNDENLWKDTIEKNPTSGRAHNNLALVYMSRGEFDLAHKHLQECDKYWTSYVYCSLNLGVVLQKLGKLTEAEDALKKAIQLQPRGVHPNFHYARFLDEVKNDCKSALPLYLKSIEATGYRYPTAEQFAVACYMKIGQKDLARELAIKSSSFQEARSTSDAALEQSMQLSVKNSLNVPGMFSLAYKYHQEGNLQEAVNRYQELIKVDPTHVQGHYNLAVIAIAKAQYPVALKHLEDTLQLDPSSSQGLFNMAFVLEKLGKNSKALETMDRLIALYPAEQSFLARKAELQTKVKVQKGKSQ